MKIGYIGLGKMGFNMVERLLEKGHEVVAYNRSEEPVNKIKELGAVGVNSLQDLVENLDDPKVIWIMVPHEAVDSVLAELNLLIKSGDTIIDGGNSNYKNTVIRAEQLKEKGINFIDVGVSGGPSGARNGACLMCGGDKDVFNNLVKLFEDLSVPQGYGYMGIAGSGHFVKMIHNGIEYGMMQSIAEGFNLMRETKEFKLDLPEISKIYNNGSVIESRLMGWLQSAYKKHGEDLEKVSGKVSNSGEGKWMVETAEEMDIPIEVIKKSLDFRIKSQDDPSYTGKILSALRNEFGGHDVDEKN